MGLIAKLSLSLSGCAILFLKTMENLDLWVIVSDAVCVCVCVCVLVLEGLLGLHRTDQLQLLQHY